MLRAYKYRIYPNEIQKEQLAKKQKGSKNRNKMRIKVARLHEKITDTRKDFYYKQVCANEDNLRNAYVDVLTEKEIKEFK